MSPTADELKYAATAMNGLSREGFTQIESLANLAASHLSRPSLSDGDYWDLAQVMRVIRSIAHDSMSAIDIEAENVGCISTRQPEEVSP